VVQIYLFGVSNDKVTGEPSTKNAGVFYYRSFYVTLLYVAAERMSMAVALERKPRFCF
jgi:hypothetical protein